MCLWPIQAYDVVQYEDALCSCPCRCHRNVVAQDNTDDESKVIAMEKAWNQLYKSRDGTALARMFHDYIVFVDDGSLESKGEFLTNNDNWKSSSFNKPIRSQSRCISSATSLSRPVSFGQSGLESGKAFVRRNRFADTWIRNDGSWECVAVSATPILPLFEQSVCEDHSGANSVVEIRRSC